MAKQPILGSLEWMNYNMRSVHPVYDLEVQQGKILADDPKTFKLASDDGTKLLGTDDVIATKRLIRWI